MPHLEERQAVLSERRHLKMAGSAHAYVRGNTLKFYEWLEAAASGVVPDGPPMWICGDCHARSRTHLEENVRATDIVLTAEDLAEIDRIVPSGAAFGTRYPRGQMNRLNV
jgi:uncharacterized protein DUF2252